MNAEMKIRQAERRERDTVALGQKSVPKRLTITPLLLKMSALKILNYSKFFKDVRVN